MGAVSELLEGIIIPKFYMVHNRFDGTHIEDVAGSVRSALRRPGTLDRIMPGKTVCFTASSREIANSVVILRTLADEFRRVGAEPILVPAMGSHGGATAEGQLKVLEHHGITEASVGCRILSSMETKNVGATPGGMEVRVDANALMCDYVVPVGRIKPHTDFHGPFESGLMKMMAIGLGKQYGAELCHQLGIHNMPVNVPAFGRVVLDNVNIPFCFGIVENALHQTHTLSAIPKECVETEEPELLVLAKRLLPVFPFEKIDTLVVERIGKEISGDGMDTNIIGRTFCEISRPYIQRIAVLDLSEISAGNFSGLGLADATTVRVFEKCNFDETYPNSITAAVPEIAKIPPVMKNDRLCVQFCLKLSPGQGKRVGHTAWIRDTLHMADYYVSDGLRAEVEKLPGVSVEPGAYEAAFDGGGNFQGFRAL